MYKGYENAEVDSLFSFFLDWCLRGRLSICAVHAKVNQDPTCLYKGKRWDYIYILILNEDNALIIGWFSLNFGSEYLVFYLFKWVVRLIRFNIINCHDR